MSNTLDQVASWPAVAAVGVASAAGPLASAGPADRPFRWASVTKLLTALAALDGVQRGLLDLDEPAGPPGSTIRHLLSHASGLGLDGDAILSRPGRLGIYSNRGIEIVADILAARSGQPFERLLAQQICLPLGMADTRLDGSPAWGAVGPLRDLLTLAIELLTPELLSENLLAEATRTAFGGLSGVLPGFGRAAALRLGPGLRDQGQQGAALGPDGQLGPHVRPFRPIRQLPLGGSGGPDRRRLPPAPRLRRQGQGRWPRLSDDVLASYAGKDL